MGSANSSGSLSFDRAVDYYDSSRALPSEAVDRVFALLRGELEGRSRILEIGVGTGRIALPLVAAGVDIYGVDLSFGMMQRLVDKAEPDSVPPLAQADATRLPFRAGAFDAAIASWVLHLIRDWRSVVAEIRRVVSGGVFLVDLGGSARGADDEIKLKFRDEAGVDWPRGPKSDAELDDEMARLGATPRPLGQIRVTRSMNLEEDIVALEKGIYSVSWDLDDERRKRAADATRRWAEERYGSLTAQRDVEVVYEWRAYDLPELRT